MDMALEGIRVIDVTIYQLGPVATRLLADLGAEVIKVERRGIGDPSRKFMPVFAAQYGINRDSHNFNYEVLNCNKKSIVVDLKQKKGREVIYRLVKRGDIFVQNFRQGVAGKLGLDYNMLSQLNPRLIYASGSGFGPEGPDSSSPGFDPLGQARSGIMFQGEPDTMPLRMGVGLSDQIGGIMLSYGILAALVVRERTGVGQEVHASLLGSSIELQGINAAAAIMTGQVFPKEDRATFNNPLNIHYKCADDKWIRLCMPQEEKWPGFCRALGLEHLISASKFKDMEERSRHSVELISILDRVFASKTRAEWLKILGGQGDMFYAPLNHPYDLADDPQVLANDYVVELAHPIYGRIKLPGFPVKLSRTPAALKTPAPALGQHTEEILSQIAGYSKDEIVELKRREVI